MDNQVFVFGSFSEDEASHFQFSLESPSKPKNTARLLPPNSPQFVNQPNSPGDLKISSPAAPTVAAGDGKWKEEMNFDFGTSQASLVGREAGPAPCNGGGNISNEEHQGLHVGNGSPRNKEASVFMHAGLSTEIGDNHKAHELENVTGLSTEIGDNHKAHELENVTGLIKEAEDSQSISTPRKSDSGAAPGDKGFDGGTSISLGKVMPKTWASLLDTETDVSHHISVHKDQKSGLLSGNASSKDVEIVQVTELSGELWLRSLNEVEVAGKRLQPRGLINKGNLCFLNATLQALLSCSPFVHLLHTLQAHGVPQVGYPTLWACVDFFKEFEFQQNNDRRARVSIDVGRPFVPSMFDSVLHSFNPHQPTTGAARSRQEDAQEFLSFTMDRLHDELLRLEGTDRSAAVIGNHTTIVANEEDDWETVGPKNRTSVIRTHTISKSALSDIFGGELCSVVKTRGSKASATVQPFLVLHLDILPEAVHTVEDALKLFAAPETLEGYRTMAGKAAVVSASKSVKLRSLPQVFILHIKRFSYGAQGSSKLHKALHFPFNLTLGRDLLASVFSSGSEQPRNYELVATVTHHGKDPSRGHYTAHSKQLDGQWLRYDDGVVSVVGASRVLQDQAYLLFYKRLVNKQ